MSGGGIAQVNVALAALSRSTSPSPSSSPQPEPSNALARGPRLRLAARGRARGASSIRASTRLIINMPPWESRPRDVYSGGHLEVIAAPASGMTRPHRPSCVAAGSHVPTGGGRRASEATGRPPRVHFRRRRRRGDLGRGLVGVVGAAHERARGDRLEAELVARRRSSAVELVRVPVADHRQVASRSGAGTGRR